MGALYEVKQGGKLSQKFMHVILTFTSILLIILICTTLCSSARFPLPHDLEALHHLHQLPKLSPNQSAHDLLTESLSTLRDILLDVSDRGSSLSLVRSESTLHDRDLASAFTGVFTGIGSAFAGGLTGGKDEEGGIAGASRYLGVGIGNGTLEGLSLNSAYLKTNTVVQPASGINSVAENLGKGLSSSVVGSLNTSAILSTTPEQRNAAFRSFAQGMGSGAATGLKLKALDTNAFNNTGLNGLVGNFGQGLSTSFLGGVDLQKMFSMASGNISSAQTNAMALAAAQGLGSGAAFALKLTNVPPTNASFDTNGASGIAGNVGQGLSTTFLENVDLKAMLASANSMLPPINILEAAQGLGSGLGEGSVVGLGIQPASAMPTSAFQNVNTSSPTAGPVVEMFARGLSQSFLQNGTAFKLFSIVGGNTTLKLNTQRVATGFGIGLVDGAQTSIENAGGVGAILSMTPQQMMGMMALPTTSNFDDTVGGAAVGLGNGLGFEVTKGLLQMLGKPVVMANTTSTLGASDTTTMISRRNPHESAGRRTLPVVYARQAETSDNTTALSKLNSLLAAQKLDPILQMGSDALGCQGIGGLAAIFVSLSKSEALSGGKLSSLTSAFGSLTNQTYTTHDQSGNIFTVNIDKALLTTNGNSLEKEFKLIVLHLALASLAYVVTIPTMLILHSVRDIAHLTGRTHLFPNTSKIQWSIALIVLLPAMSVTLAFGFLAEGSRNHFYSPHGILGLLLLGLTLAAFPLAYIRASTALARISFNIVLTLILLLTIIELMTGFVDLSTISSCLFQFLPQVLFVVAGFLFAVPIFSAISVMGIEALMAKWSSSGTIRLGNVVDGDREKLVGGGGGGGSGRGGEGEKKGHRVVISRPVVMMPDGQI